MTLSEKAESFRQQHHEKKILVLPNVWDTITARLICAAGFRSVATASFSVAASNGFEDGEKIPFGQLTRVVAEITDAVDVPVSVDFERGYANDLTSLADNVTRLLAAGAVGVNIEDRAPDGKSLVSISEQCRKLETIRKTAEAHGVHLFINARTDAYLLKSTSSYREDTIERGKAYRDAGADCFYPVLIDNYPDMEQVLAEISLPVNVLLVKPVADLKKLEHIGIRRVSLGPASLRYVLTRFRNMATALQHYDTAELFRDELMANDAVMALLKKQA